MYDVSAESLTVPPRAALALDWYDRRRRALPWRAGPGEKVDPYAVWLSEIMLQQTTVAAVKPYFAAFLTRWPNVKVLAKAPVEEVMRQWAGLGYYSRARNLHACAMTIADNFGGRFPDDEAKLLKLPGLGPYTAAAIAAIAFGRRAVVVDGNVERVIARLYAIETPLPAAKPLIRKRADELTPYERPGDYAQAMMDIGATICTPKQPACVICPLSAECAGRATGDPARFPIKAQKPERPRRRGAAYFIARKDGAILMRTRAPKGLLGGMTEIPGTPWETDSSADFDEVFAQKHAPIAARFRKLDAEVEHVFTHFALRLSIYMAKVEDGKPAPGDCRWVSAENLDKEALPSLMRKVIAAARAAD